MSCILVPLKITQYQVTALHLASDKGHRETVQLLLEKGADPNVQDMVSVLWNSSPVPVMCTFIHCINTKLLAINLSMECILVLILQNDVSVLLKSSLYLYLQYIPQDVMVD